MELESKIFYSDSEIKKRKRIEYSLSGMGGAGTLSMVKGLSASGQYCIYIRCRAGIKNLFNLLDFEGLSVWDSEKDGELKFVSFEERDKNKKIYKRWGFSSGQLQYTENKSGLVQEREVSYSRSGLAPEHRVFDPLSIVAFFHLEKIPPNSLSTIYILGKQQLLKLSLETIPAGEELKVLFKADGMSPLWGKALEKTEITLSKEGHIKEVSVPAPMFIGKVEMKMNICEDIARETIDEVLTSFASN